ncbi:ATP/GTP-binding protein [Streptomyces sp. NPDC047042]|uniref:GTP-binding protein n=1 Tax=Streptomyces sp. NPDC047042 TaxID=3154807 RepID=UPI003410F75A
MHLPGTEPVLVKILIAGPFGVGKTTMINTLSETVPLHTEEIMTEASAGIDDLAGVRDKTTTTVAIDFGRRTLSDDLILYLFGTPGQERFRPLWEDIAQGALGALVLADTRRLDDSFEVLDLIEQQGLRHAVVVNAFDDAPVYPLHTLREALDLDPDTPLLTCDAREYPSAIDALIELVTHLINHSALDAAAS